MLQNIRCLSFDSTQKIKYKIWPKEAEEEKKRNENEKATKGNGRILSSISKNAIHIPQTNIAIQKWQPETRLFRMTYRSNELYFAKVQVLFYYVSCLPAIFTYIYYAKFVTQDDIGYKVLIIMSRIHSTRYFKYKREKESIYLFKIYIYNLIYYVNGNDIKLYKLI